MNLKINHFLFYFLVKSFLIFNIFSRTIVLQFNELYNNDIYNCDTQISNSKNNRLLDTNEDITFFSNLYENLIYTIINIGIKNQLTMNIFNSNTNVYSFNNIDICYKKSQYNYSLSDSSKIIQDIKGDDYFPGYYIINDTIKLYMMENNEIKLKEIEDFQFRFDKPRKSWGNQNSKENIFCAEIGIQINEEKKIPSKFIKQLKDKDLINSYIITFNYSDNYEGYIYIGEYPHEYSPTNFNQSQILTTYIIPKQFHSQYRIIMENIYIQNEGKQIKILSKEVYIHIESGIIECPTQYFNIIKNIFFIKYLNNSICEIINMTQNLNLYNMIVCKNNNNFDIISFPTLFFEHLDLNYTFNLDYRDLFLKKNNKYYFLIIYSSFSGGYWKLGKPFLKKYQITLNLDAKSISFYNHNIKEEIKDNKNNNEKTEYIILIVICIILIIILFIISLLFIKKLKGERKKRANELKDDEYEYNANECEIENENINYKKFLEGEINKDKNNSFHEDKNEVNVIN